MDAIANNGSKGIKDRVCNEGGQCAELRLWRAHRIICEHDR